MPDNAQSTPQERRAPAPSPVRAPNRPKHPEGNLLFWMRVATPIFVVLVLSSWAYYLVNIQTIRFKRYVRRGMAASPAKDYATVEANLRGALGIAEKIYRNRGTQIWNDDEFVIVLNTLSAAYLEQGKNAEVESLSRQAVPSLIKKFGEDSPKLISCYENLGKALFALRNPEDGEMFYREAVGIATKAYGPRDERTTQLALSLLDFLRAARRTDEAAKLEAEIRRVRGVSEKP